MSQTTLTGAGIYAKLESVVVISGCFLIYSIVIEGKI